MTRTTISAFCVFVLLNSTGLASDPLGVHVHAFALATTHSCLTDLGYKHGSEERADVEAALEDVGVQFMKSDMQKEVHKWRREVAKKSAKERVRFARKHADRIGEINEFILGQVEQCLGDRDKAKRFREMLVQEYARDGSFASVMLLLRLPVAEANLMECENRFAELSRVTQSSVKQQKYDAACALVGQSGLASQDKIDKAAGELWLGLKQEPVISNIMQSRLFFPYSIQVLTNPQLHVHLELTPKVVGELRTLRKELEGKYGSEQLAELATRTTDINEMRKEIDGWFKEIDVAVQNTLGDKAKARRINEIVFQEHMAAMQFGPALRFLGTQPDANMLVARNTAFAKAFYEATVSDTFSAKTVLLEAFPDQQRRILAAFRDVYIPNSPWDDIFSLTEHEKIRAAVLRKALDAQPKTEQRNVRRGRG